MPYEVMFLEFLENGGVLSSAMIQVYANQLVRLLSLLEELERELPKWGESDFTKERGEGAAQMMQSAVVHVRHLRLRSAEKQLHRILTRLAAGQTTTGELSGLLRQLRIRMEEDLEDRAFSCVTDTEKIDRFFKADQQSGRLLFKVSMRYLTKRCWDRFKNPKTTSWMQRGVISPLATRDASSI